MHPNHAFLLDYARRARPSGRYLDFGCGGGEIVRADDRVWGCDDFSLNTNPQHPRIREAASGQIPFPDDWFDVVFTNMVFEHVKDLSGVLGEMRRVLKPDGVSVHLFPSLEVWREGHCGIPFAHRLPRACYLGAWYRLGAGVERWRKPWVDYWLNYLQTSVSYRREREVHRLFAAAGFRVRHIEQDLIRHRFGWPVPIVGPFLVKRLATMALEATVTR